MPHASLDSTFASIDIGSHTIRLLIAQTLENRELLPLHVDRRITRLARNFGEGALLQQPGMEESIAVLKEYGTLLKHHKVRSVACGATGVVRRARNGEAFLEEIRKATGMPATILSESAEAFLSAKGILSVLPHREEFVLSFDLGGSSTEFLLMDTRQATHTWSTSIFIGAATITERFLRGDPPSPSSILEATDAVREALDPAFRAIRDHLNTALTAPPAMQLAGTAGTATTLASMNLEMTRYEPERINGLVLTENWVRKTAALLARLPLVRRRDLPGLETGREDIIFAGALIVQEILHGLGQNQFTVTDAGLLEGLLLDLVEKELGRPQTLATPLTWRRQKG